MIGTLLATGLVVVGAGSALSFAPRTFRPGLAAQALGIALVGLAGLAVFASGDELGSLVHERARAATRRRSDERLLPLRPGGRRGAGGRLRDALPRAATRRDASRPALTGVFLLVLALVLVRARPADVPRRLGADDARAGRDHPRRAPRPRGAELGVRLHRAHAPHGRRHLDRGAAARRRRSVRRRERRSRPGLARRSRSPSPRSSAWGRRRASCRCTRGCRARTRSPRRTSRR